MVVHWCPYSRAKAWQSNCYYTGERLRFIEVALIWLTEPWTPLGVSAITLLTESAVPLMSPPAPDSGFVSANDHCIWRACRPSAPASRPKPVPGSHTASEQFRLAALLTANAKYTAMASA